jgi:hypothetical protein
MNCKLKTKLRKLIKNHVAAQQALSWIGTADPEDMPAIEEEARIRRNQLNEFIRSITIKQEVE